MKRHRVADCGKPEETSLTLVAQAVICTPVQFILDEYGAPIAPPLRSSHAQEAASLDPRVRILPPQAGAFSVNWENLRWRGSTNSLRSIRQQ
jgi:hypothetical protein